MGQMIGETIGTKGTISIIVWSHKTVGDCLAKGLGASDLVYCLFYGS